MEVMAVATADKDGFDCLEKRINSDWKIYIDTCSLYRTIDEGSAFWQKFESLLMRKDAKFTVTAAAFAEFKKHKHSIDHPMKASAEELERVLSRYGKTRKNLMLVAGDAGGSFHDNAIVSLVKKRCLDYPQVYITNDLASAWDVYSTVENSASSTRGLKPLLIYKVVSKGKLARHCELQELSKLSSAEIKEYFRLRSEKHYEEARDYLVSITQGSHDRGHLEQAVSARGEKASGNTVEEEGSFERLAQNLTIANSYYACATGMSLKAYQGNRTFDVRLGKRIGRGGEGFVFEAEVSGAAPASYLAKIYKKKTLYGSDRARETIEKIRYLVERKYSNKSLNAHVNLGKCVKFPLMVLASPEGNFVGYLMEKATGISLAEFISDAAIEGEFRKKYPAITKIDLIEICLNFLDVIDALHRCGIIVGDLNANNVLVDIDSKHVTFLDADSYQYGDSWPCHVGVETYTSPEFLKKRDTPFRTVQNELFVVARILCEILMLVDNPYNSRASTDPVQDMLAGLFRYTFDLGSQRVTNREAPSEDLAIRWGHLSKKLKDAFGNTFHCEGAYWNPGKRLEASEWKRMLLAYRGAIEKSLAKGDGWESNDVFPHEKKAWVIAFSCTSCGDRGEQDGNKFVQALRDCHLKLPGDILNYARAQCFSCFCTDHEIESVSCSRCGKPMYTVQGSYASPVCYECRMKARETSATYRRGSTSPTRYGDVQTFSRKDGFVSSKASSSAWDRAKGSMAENQKLLPVEIPPAYKQATEKQPIDPKVNAKPQVIQPQEKRLSVIEWIKKTIGF